MSGVLLKIIESSMVHACNPSYTGGRGPALVKKKNKTEILSEK
jgi:hypothetical protein